MAKRKREAENLHASSMVNSDVPPKVAKSNGLADVKPSPSTSTVQIVAGSYERVLHGITASISDLTTFKPTTQFANSFLFNAHASAIRCVAISPLPDTATGDNAGVYLATGGSDERVNVYSLSASPSSDDDRLPAMPSLGISKISENPRNRELGSLMHHSSTITSLCFPTRSKLLSASEDNTVAISRTRDLTTVSTIKAPRPKVQGQPSGDTAPPGATPVGINDFAIHPSMKLMISVGRGEKTMRLWNLVTGKKASVLNFDRDILQAVMESKHSSGEGRKIVWDHSGSEFAVSFERGVVVFGDDAKPKCAGLPQPLTKVHQISYHSIGDQIVLAVSTEDGRIIFFDPNDTIKAPDTSIANARCIAQLGGKAVQMGVRVKDFKILDVKSHEIETSETIVVAASSDGTIRLWQIKAADFKTPSRTDETAQIGNLIGSYDTSSRLTCLDAFVMLPPVEEEEGLSAFEGLTETEGELSTESESDDD